MALVVHDIVFMKPRKKTLPAGWSERGDKLTQRFHQNI